MISSAKIKTAPPGKLRVVVLDIDWVLAVLLDPFARMALEKTFIEWLLERGLFIDAIEQHILLPGTLEFIQYLFSLPGLRVCFFSTGTSERNEIFVENLLIQALGNEIYKKIKGQIKIFSREHAEISGFKDLGLVLQTADQLASTILIDDYKDNLPEGQIANGLIPLQGGHFQLQNIDSERILENHNLFSANQIFYIVGLLKKLFAMTEEGSSITENLFKLQYKMIKIKQCELEKEGLAKGNRDFGYEFNFDLYKDKALYLEGHQELKYFNKNLAFYGEKANEFFGFKNKDGLPVKLGRPTTALKTSNAGLFFTQKRPITFLKKSFFSPFKSIHHPAPSNPKIRTTAIYSGVSLVLLTGSFFAAPFNKMAKKLKWPCEDYIKNLSVKQGPR